MGTKNVHLMMLVDSVNDVVKAMKDNEAVQELIRQDARLRKALVAQLQTLEQIRDELKNG